MLVWLSVAVQSTTFAEEEKLYYFVDETGVTHLSNTPTDPRYKSFDATKRGKESDASSHAEEPVAPEGSVPPTFEAPEQSSEQPYAEPPTVPEPVPGRAR